MHKCVLFRHLRRCANHCYTEMPLETKISEKTKNICSLDSLNIYFIQFIIHSLYTQANRIDIKTLIKMFFKIIFKAKSNTKVFSLTVPMVVYIIYAIIDYSDISLYTLLLVKVGRNN